jgi:5-formaminoimidazole-4-carboxamide-1-beta-D-ribofuranosyl 5'-monophosphate synthetase
MAPLHENRNIFDILPFEIILHILKFMDVRNYTGLSCASHRALELVDAAVAAEYTTVAVEFDATEKTMTGRMIRWVKRYEAEMAMRAVCYAPPEDDL